MNDAPGDLKTFYTVADMKKLDKNEAYSPYARKPDHKFFLETDFYGIDNDWFHHKEYYPFLGGKFFNFVFMLRISWTNLILIDYSVDYNNMYSYCYN